MFTPVGRLGVQPSKFWEEPSSKNQIINDEPSDRQVEDGPVDEVSPTTIGS